MTPCEKVLEDLAAIVDGDRDVIARHADHLASCDDCRDARHDAQMLAKRLPGAGADYVVDPKLADRVMVLVNDVPVPLPLPLFPNPQPARPSLRVRKPVWIAAAAAVGLAATGTVYVAATRPHGIASDPSASIFRPTIHLVRVSRAAADGADGVMYRVAGGQWRPLRTSDRLPPNVEVRTDERTRAWLAVDSETLVLDHATSMATAFYAHELTLTAGRVDMTTYRPWQFRAADTSVHLDGTIRMVATASDHRAVLQVVHGVAQISNVGVHERVSSGERGVVDHGQFSVSYASSANEAAWSEPTIAKPDEGLAGIGALRAYKPGESRDRDWNLALAKHDVAIRISGPIARTEITEVFRNDSAVELEGVYRFPLPHDAQIDGLALDVDNKFVDGAFVDKERAGKIWKGVIDRARPIQIARPDDIVWVPGPWRDPALLDWQRGGKFELKIFPIPAHGQRTIKIAYTQVVDQRGSQRRYVYPLPHSSDGSTVADAMSVDVEVRGARPNLVSASNYTLVPDLARADRNALTFSQSGFVPRGDLVIDYQPDTTAELRAWASQGGAAIAPDLGLATKHGVGIDPKVVAEQTRIAADLRPTAVLELHPTLPRWTRYQGRDYAIVVDSSQSMVGERWKHASTLVWELLQNMDPRDTASVLACDSECRRSGPSAAAGGMATINTSRWLGKQQVAGASDLVTSLRAGASNLSNQRDRWVIYVGDGFATTGFRKAADIERALHGLDAHVTAIGVGEDVDATVLSAAARGGGGSYVAWSPGTSATTIAIEALETSYGATLSDPTITLPVGLSDAAPTVVPTLRPGQGVLISARMTGDVSGDVILRGTLAGQPYEQHYRLQLPMPIAANGNGFVPRLWASLAIDELERAGHGEDRVKEIALSQAYGVMSRETSLLVLESQAMFDAFGVDRHRPSVQWTGEEAVDEVTTDAQPVSKSLMTGAAAQPKKMPQTFSGDMADPYGPPMRHVPPSVRTRMIAMHRVWTRLAAVSNYAGVSPELTKELALGEAALHAAPNSREKHRALVQALSFAGDLDHAIEIATSWQQRDELDPQVLGYLADFAGRAGQREQSLRTLAGLVDLDPDKVALHERMVAAYERVGRLAQACGHRVTLASLQRTPATAALAARCLRASGQTDDAAIVMGELASDAQRGQAERLAMVNPVEAKLAGELVVRATWDRGQDLDLTLVASDGTRISLQGGRSDVVVTNATAHDREELALATAKRGSYLVEITRADATQLGLVRGTIEVTVLGVTRSLPFELTGNHATIGRIDVTLQSHLERVESRIPDNPF